VSILKTEHSPFDGMKIHVVSLTITVLPKLDARPPVDRDRCPWLHFAYISLVTDITIV